MTLDEWAKKTIELQYKLNDPKYNLVKINLEYKEFYDSLDPTFGTLIEVGGHPTHFHDSWVRNLSERRTMNHFKSSFTARAPQHNPDTNDDWYAMVEISLASKVSIRGINNSCIYNLVFNDEGLCIVYWNGRFRMKTLIIRDFIEPITFKLRD